MGQAKKQIKAIKHKIKNGKLQVKTVKMETTFDQVKELAFIAAMSNYLEEVGIEQDVISFLDDALAGDAKKEKIALNVAAKFENKFESLGLTENDIKNVTLVNKDAYDSPEQFFKEEGLV